jgi:hypothetical protein
MAHLMDERRAAGPPISSAVTSDAKESIRASNLLL